MSDLTPDFGLPVFVGYEAVRIIGQDDGPLMVRDPSGGFAASGWHKMMEDPDGEHRYSFCQSRPRRTAGRYSDWLMLDDPALRLTDSPWPGLPVPVEWAASQPRSEYGREFEVEPAWQPVIIPAHDIETLGIDGQPGTKRVPERTVNPSKAYARVRRLPCDRTGIVVGLTWRDEGVPTQPTYGEDGDCGYLSLERRIPLVEVLLHPIGKLGKAQLILAHVNDLKVSS